MQKMPIRHQLSYLFARVTGVDVMCTHMVSERKSAPVENERNIEVACFYWAEARPAGNKAGYYTITYNLYERNIGGDDLHVSGDRTLRQKRMKRNGRMEFTRDEALVALRLLEQRWNEDGRRILKDEPWALRALSIHRPA
jgi:hypothetical protein